MEELLLILLIVLLLLAIGIILFRSICKQFSPYLAAIIGYFTFVEYADFGFIHGLAPWVWLIVGAIATWKFDKKWFWIFIVLLIFTAFSFAFLYFFFGIIGVSITLS